MSRPLVPRPPAGDPDSNAPLAAPKTKKISTACGACKQRKTRCSGSSPCDACASRGTPCVYDVASDQRRKIAAQRNLHDLTESQIHLARLQQVLGGIVATLRVGDALAQRSLIDTIRSTNDLSQIAAHTRNARRDDPAIEEAYSRIGFVINADEEPPPPSRPPTTSNPRGFASSGGGDAPSLSACFDPQLHVDSQP